MNNNLPEMRCFEYKGFSKFEKSDEGFKNNNIKISDDNSGELTLKGNPEELGSETKEDFNYENRSKGREKLFIGFVSQFASKGSLNIYNIFKQLFDSIQKNKSISEHFKIFLF